MSKIEIFYLFVSFIGILMGAAHYPQAFRILKTKSSESVSLITYSIFAVGCWVWLIYGIVIDELPIIISFSIGSVGASWVLFLSLKYRGKTRNDEAA